MLIWLKRALEWRYLIWIKWLTLISNNLIVDNSHRHFIIASSECHALIRIFWKHKRVLSVRLPQPIKLYWAQTIALRHKNLKIALGCLLFSCSHYDMTSLSLYSCTNQHQPLHNDVDTWDWRAAFVMSNFPQYVNKSSFISFRSFYQKLILVPAYFPWKKFRFEFKFAKAAK